ncbi:MAG: hypothetical protein P4L22_05390 [Candidatus Babeliales bacterium]|nr:hypothetical protein [Candidatus Babeliales bacterium]
MKFSSVLFFSLIMMQSGYLISWEIPRFVMLKTHAFVNTAIEATKPHLTKRNAVIGGVLVTIVGAFLIKKLSKKGSPKKAGMRDVRTYADVAAGEKRAKDREPYNIASLFDNK